MNPLRLMAKSTILPQILAVHFTLVCLCSECESHTKCSALAVTSSLRQCLALCFLTSGSGSVLRHTTHTSVCIQILSVPHPPVPTDLQGRGPFLPGVSGVFTTILSLSRTSSSSWAHYYGPALPDQRFPRTRTTSDELATAFLASSNG